MCFLQDGFRQNHLLLFLNIELHIEVNHNRLWLIYILFDRHFIGFETNLPTKKAQKNITTKTQLVIRESTSKRGIVPI